MGLEKFNLYPNQQLFQKAVGGAHLEHRYDEMLASREHFNRHEKLLLGNEAALIPDDAWREVDEMTVRVMREDEGQAYMMDLMALTRGVDIGKTVHVYRTSSDTSSRVNITLNGQTPTLMDNVTYTYNGHPIPIFDSGYGMNWRRFRAMQSEGFDGLSDDQEAAVANVSQVCAQYILNGDTSINADGYIGYGIKNHPETNVMDLDSSGHNIDLSDFSTTADNIEDFFVRDFQRVIHDNLIMGPLNLYISPAIERRWSRSYSGSSGFKNGTIRDFLMSQPFIGEIKKTYELTGNQFFAFPMQSKYIRLLLGMAMSTIAIPRNMMTDDFNFKVLKAAGLEIRADANSRSGVIYGTEVA